MTTRKLTNRRDRHYLNDEGDCVACSEFEGPWPDDESEEYAGAVVIDRLGSQANSVPETECQPAA